MSGIIEKPVHRRVRNSKDFLDFRGFRGVIEVGNFVCTRDFWHDFFTFLFKLEFFLQKNLFKITF